MVVTKSQLLSDIKAMGVEKGDVVLVHSSYKSIGNVEGGANTVIQALIEAVGDIGTIVFPTLSYSPCTQTKQFDYANTPSCTGYLSEQFRLYHGSVRSLHPTHSCTAYGKDAEFLTSTHHLDNTPVGSNSPITKLALLGGKVLMVGCGLRPMTSMHGVEETIGRHLIDSKSTTYTITDAQNKTFTKEYYNHNFHPEKGPQYKQCYDRIVNVMPEGSIVKGYIGQAESYLVDASILWKTAHRVMLENRDYFVDFLGIK